MKESPLFSAVGSEYALIARHVGQNEHLAAVKQETVFLASAADIYSDAVTIGRVAPRFFGFLSGGTFAREEHTASDAVLGFSENVSAKLLGAEPASLGSLRSVRLFAFGSQCGDVAGGESPSARAEAEQGTYCKHDR